MKNSKLMELAFGLGLYWSWELKTVFGVGFLLGWACFLVVCVPFVMYFSRNKEDSLAYMAALIHGGLIAMTVGLLALITEANRPDIFAFPMAIAWGAGIMLLGRAAFWVEDFMDDGGYSGMAHLGYYSFSRSGYMAAGVLATMTFVVMEYAGWLQYWWVSLLILLLGLCLAVGHIAQDYQIKLPFRRGLATYGLATTVMAMVSLIRAL